jgi:hypothetical protein
MLLPGQYAKPDPASVETLQEFEVQIYANPQQVIIAAWIPKQKRMIQIPMGRIEFAALHREMANALERVPTEEEIASELDGNGAG